MNKKLLVILVFGALPFLLVWSGFVLTGFSYNPRDVFQGDIFWGLSVMYWLLWVCTIPLQLESIDDINKGPAR